MAHELTVSESSLVPFLEEQGMGEALKPLIREIHLFDTFIAGTSYLKDPSVLNGLKPETRLTLRREDNKFDSNAIMILNPEGQKLGYVPEKDNVVFSRLMDAGKALNAHVISQTVKGTFHRISIGIYLVDF